MDKFTEQAFINAEEAMKERMDEYWKDITSDDYKGVLIRAMLSAGPAESSRMVTALEQSAFCETMRKYEQFLVMGGFALGFGAGRKSMLEDAQ